VSSPPDRPEASCDLPVTSAPDGTDLTLIRWMLSLSPTERLRVLQSHVEAIEAIRAANPGWTSAPS
jgi:hypothetical protein